MGASDWNYRVPYAGSVEATLIAVQEQILVSGDYLWPWDDVVVRPSSLAALDAAKETEEFWDEGTHTILDTGRITTADDDGDGAIRPLSSAELNQVFGTEQPSADDFDRVHRPGPSGPLFNLLGERWTGRSVVIYKNGAPDEVYFWGYSGD